MPDYIVHKTDINAPSINVPEKRVETSSLDVALFGKIKLEYGERLNEDLLNILENFSCPEEADAVTATPDLTQVSNAQLSKPTIGQFWYNSTRELIYFWTGSEWTATNSREDMAANWGQILDGEQLPRPVSPISGYTFPYSECIWTVAPSVLTGKIGYMACATDAQAKLTMRYRLAGTNDILSGQANYLIIGIRSGAVETGPFPTPPMPSVTPTITPTMTMTVTPTVTPTPTMTLTPTPTNTMTPSVTVTPQPSVSPTLTPTPQPSSTATPSPTPANSPIPSQTPTPTPEVPITAIIFGGDYRCNTQVVNGATAGAGVGFNNAGASSKSGLQTSGPTRWLAAGYNAADFEVSFSGDYFVQFPGNSWYSTPAGSNTMGSPGAWYNMGNGVAWSVGTTRDIANFTLSYTIRQISTGRAVSGSIELYCIAGTPI